MEKIELSMLARTHVTPPPPHYERHKLSPSYSFTMCACLCTCALTWILHAHTGLNFVPSRSSGDVCLLCKHLCTHIHRITATMGGGEQQSTTAWPRFAHSKMTEKSERRQTGRGQRNNAVLFKQHPAGVSPAIYQHDSNRFLYTQEILKTSMKLY